MQDKKVLFYWGKRRNTLTMADLRHYLALYGQTSHITFSNLVNVTKLKEEKCSTFLTTFEQL
jgi:hypothetical protein